MKASIANRQKDRLKEWGASFIEEVSEDLTDHQMPTWVRTAGIIVAFLVSVATGHHFPHVRHDQSRTSDARCSRHGLATQEQNTNPCPKPGYRIAAGLSVHRFAGNARADSGHDRPRPTGDRLRNTTSVSRLVLMR